MKTSAILLTFATAATAVLGSPIAQPKDAGTVGTDGKFTVGIWTGVALGILADAYDNEPGLEAVKAVKRGEMPANPVLSREAVARVLARAAADKDAATAGSDYILTLLGYTGTKAADRVLARAAANKDAAASGSDIILGLLGYAGVDAKASTQ